MGMNVNFGTGVNSYAQTQKAGATYSAGTSAAVNPFAQPAYDTVSFSGKNKQTTNEQEGMSTGAKIGLAATAATLIVGAIAAYKGKKLNEATSQKATGLIKNIGTGLKAMFTKSGRALYKTSVTDKADNIVKAAAEAGSKNTEKVQKGATKFTQETMEVAGNNAKKAQSKITSLNNEIAKLDPKKDAEKIAKLQKQIAEQQKTVDKFVNLTTSENLATDKTYSKLKEARTNAQKAYDSANSSKTKLEAKQTDLKKKKQAIESISKKKRTAQQTEQLKKYNEELTKIDGKIRAITDGTKDKNGKVLTKPFNVLQDEYKNSLTSLRQYKQATKTLSSAQVTANNNNQLYQQILAKKNGTLTPDQKLLDRVDVLKQQAGDSGSALNKLKKAWEDFVKTGTYDDKIFGKVEVKIQ